MKILIFSDVHWGRYSSIIRTPGNKYSYRLEMLIKSMNWVNAIAIKEECSAMICAGDMLDKSSCLDDEITALRDIKWNNLPCYFLCGNHESSVSDLRFSSLKALESENHFIISEPTTWKYENNENEIRFLPYVVESNRKSIEDYFGKGLGKTIIISHNDIQGIKYGGFESKIGFTIKEIENNCDVCFNGHLHNQAKISKKILNVGSLSAHNFTNDSYKYKYGIWILDTEKLTVDFIENPYAFNFFQVEINNEDDINNFNLPAQNCIVNFKCQDDLIFKLKEKIKTLNLVEYRILSVKKINQTKEVINNIEMIDTNKKFSEFMIEKLGNSDIVNEEIMEVIK